MSVALLFASGSRAPAAPQSASLLINDSYATMPAWDDVYNAPWNTNAGQIAWTIEPTGGATDPTGNASYLRVVRQEAGSSVMVKHYTVPQNTDIYVGAWMRCPSDYNPAPGENYWMEMSYKIGAWGGQDFDDPATGGSWFPLVMKFAYAGPNGNGNVWTWYASAAPKNSGSSTVVSIGYKVGTLYNTTTYQQPPVGPDLGYDGIFISDQPMTTPPAPPSGPGPLPSPTPSTGGGDDKNRNLCGCGTAGAPGGSGLGLAMILAGGLLALRRR